jgi:hypothetical protein
LDRRLIAFRELAPKLAVCPGGLLTELTETIYELRSARLGLAGQIWRRKNEIARQTIQEFIARRHTYGSAYEIHFINIYSNFIANQGEHGIPFQEDPFTTEERTGVKAKDLIAGANYVAPYLTPERLAMTLAKQYLDSIRDVVRRVTPIDQPIPGDKLAEVNNSVQTMEIALRGQSAFFDAHSVLLTTDYVTYRLVAGPTPMAVDLLMRLQEAEQIDADEPARLLEITVQEANGENAAVRLMQWGDLFWVERDDVRDELTSALLAEVDAALSKFEPAVFEAAMSAIQTIVKRLLSIQAREEAILNGHADTIRADNELIIQAHKNGWISDAAVREFIAAKRADGVPGRLLALQKGHAGALRADNELIMQARENGWIDNAGLREFIAAKDRDGLPGRAKAMLVGRADPLRADNELIIHARENDWVDDAAVREFIAAKPRFHVPGRKGALLNGHANAIRVDNELIIQALENGWLDDAAFLKLMDLKLKNGSSGRAMALRNGHADAIHADNKLLFHLAEAGLLPEAALRQQLLDKIEECALAAAIASKEGKHAAVQSHQALIDAARTRGWLPDMSEQRLSAGPSSPGEQRGLAIHASELPSLGGLCETLGLDQNLIVCDWTVRSAGSDPRAQLTFRNDANGEVIISNGQPLQFTEEAIRAVGIDPDALGRREALAAAERRKTAETLAASADAPAFSQFFHELDETISALNHETRGLIAPVLDQVLTAIGAQPALRDACLAVAAKTRNAGDAGVFTALRNMTKGCVTQAGELRAAGILKTLRRMIEACAAHQPEQPGPLDEVEQRAWGVAKFRLDALRRLAERARAAGSSRAADWATQTPRIVKALETGDSAQAEALLKGLEGANAAGRPKGGKAGPPLLDALLADKQWNRFLDRAHDEELTACRTSRGQSQ